MVYFEFAEWLAIAAAVLLILVCAGVVWRAVWLPSDVRTVACCGACGQPVGELQSPRCTECGGQFNRVGVSTPSMVVRYRAGLGWALLAWTTLMVAIGGVVLSIQQQQAAMQGWAAFAPITPAGGAQQITIEREYTPRSRSGPHPFRAELAVDAVTDDGLVTSGTAKLRLRKTGTAERVSLEMSLPDGAYVLKAADDRELARGGSVDQEVIETLFAQLNVGMPPETSLAFSRQFVEILNETRFDPESLNHGGMGAIDLSQPTLMSSGGSSSTGPVGGFAPRAAMPAFPAPSWWSGMLVSGAILSGFWIAGVIAITLRNRQLLRPKAPTAG